MTNKKASATARTTANATADSFASLRNDKQKGKCNGKEHPQQQQQIPPLRCGMTNQKAGAKANKEASAQARTTATATAKTDSFTPLRSGRDDRRRQRQHEQTADSSAALRNDKQKGKCNGKNNCYAHEVSIS